MASLKTYEKIRDLRDREKLDKQRKYQSDMESFEMYAHQLYEALKKKEDAVNQFNDQLSKGAVEVQSFIHHQKHIQHLENVIQSLQPSVQHARVKMQQSQEALSNAHVEVKKFDKVIERKEDQQLQMLKDQEIQAMDELSLQQFLNYQNR
ncbi:flagellar export protein FliJ [Halobacillus litoralis]|uniref:flagellar export protein FliJ n=1 Tax=Halobacillus litoralis TaxID=45668 RepID=UPI001CFEA6AC|nr:flagellar export protein FliJ [Halobacillus litoralis]